MRWWLFVTVIRIGGAGWIQGQPPMDDERPRLVERPGKDVDPGSQREWTCYLSCRCR